MAYGVMVDSMGSQIMIQRLADVVGPLQLPHVRARRPENYPRDAVSSLEVVRNRIPFVLGGPCPLPEPLENITIQLCCTELLTNRRAEIRPTADKVLSRLQRGPAA